MRKPIIAGNWKMNNTIEEGLALIDGIKGNNLSEKVEIVVCVPFTVLSEASKALKGTQIKLGAQNMYFEEKGAFTGEISPIMLKELNVEYVIIGHSERRQIFGETDELINKKVCSAIKYNVNPIICVGETLEERESKKEVEIVTKQVEKALKDINKEDVKNIIIAYEPIWAIGTGKTASSDDADNMLNAIREKLRELYDSEVKDIVRLQYGGSVKPTTITELMSRENVDGALVGGASLKSEDFTQLINF